MVTQKVVLVIEERGCLPGITLHSGPCAIVEDSFPHAPLQVHLHFKYVHGLEDSWVFWSIRKGSQIKNNQSKL